MNNLKQLVIRSYKKLHRTRLKVFAGDERALNAARLEINKKYKDSKHVTDVEAIKAMIKLSEDVERELRTTVIQAREVRPGVFEARITDDTAKLDNVPFDDNAVPPEGIPRRKKCCKEVNNSTQN